MRVVLLALLFTACGVSSSPENYNLKSLSDIQLTSSNHFHGYGQSQCFACHNISNFHLVDTVGGDLNQAWQLVATEGVSSCAFCHGNNGVP